MTLSREILRRRVPALSDADAVLFDLDGVLTPTADVHMRAWQTMFDELFSAWGVAPAYTEGDYFAHLDGKRRYDGVASVLRSRDIEVPWGEPDDDPGIDSVCGIGNRKNSVFLRVLAQEGIAPYPGSLALLDALREAGMPLGLVSSSKNAGPVLAQAGIADRFAATVDGVVAEEHHLASKPAPDMFLDAAEQLGVDASRAVVVEDALSGVASGVAGGFALVIGVDRGAGADALRAAGAGTVITDLAELLKGHE